MAVLSLVSLLLLAVGSASTVAPGDCPSLMLLQVNAEKLDKVRRQGAPESESSKNEVSSLPPIRTLLGNSKGAADDLSGEVDRLQEKLRAFQEEQASKIASKRATYEHNLTSLQKDILSTEEANAVISNKTDRVKHNNQALLQHAHELSRDNDALRADLAALRINLTTAVEFADRALDGANDTEAEQLMVIRDLEARHAANSAHREHRERLDEIASAMDVSLLHFGNAGNVSTDEDPQSMVVSLGSSFEALVEGQHATEASLRQLFLKHYSEGSEQLAELVQHQGRLNHTLSTVTELHADLKEAVAHLEQVHDSLESQTQQLRGFADSLSRRELPAEASSAPEA